MEITSNDIMIFFSMSLAIVLLSLAAPPMNLTDDSAQQASDIPEFNVSQDLFNFSGEFPENPGAPSSGELEHYDNGSKSGYGVQQTWLHGDTGSGNKLFIYNGSGGGGPEPNVTMRQWESAPTARVVGKDTVTIQNVGATKTISNDSYTIKFTLTHNVTGNDSYQRMTYQIEEQPEDVTFLGRVPIVGSLVSGTSQLAGMVGWIGAILWWFLTTTTEVILQSVLALAKMAYGVFGMMFWIASTYTAIISSATGWAKVIVSVPVVMLSLEIAKVHAVVISLLPTT